ncbi:MAG: hypothetical protein S0880_36825 [Actinomycetota bacterium]|nr:hypothetical protein [Actinomycetota bacterium]
MSSVEYHWEFAEQLETLAATDISAFSDVVNLVKALDGYGHEIEGDDHASDLSHPIVSSRLDLWALRRTPPTWAAPDAAGPPVLRIPYVWMSDERGREYALVLFIGDKTDLGNAWYPRAVTRIEGTMIPVWEGQHPGHRARPKRRRTW